jgi:group I intron endonuclease
MKYKIYKYTNLINGKIYVGKTKNLNRRVKEHKNQNDDCKYFNNALKRYGIQSFDIEILCEIDSFEEASKLEGQYIVQLNCLAPNGYNLTLDTNQGREFHVTTKRLMSVNTQGTCKRSKVTSKYIGVKHRRGLNVFRMSITKDGVDYGKYFKIEKKAAEAYDKVAIHLYGKCARVNFPEKVTSYSSENLQKFFEFVIKKKEKTSRFRGISYMKECDLWRAIYYDKRTKKQIHIGTFKTETDAKLELDNYEKSIKKY